MILNNYLIAHISHTVCPNMCKKHLLYKDLHNQNAQPYKYQMKLPQKLITS